ncbi:MAG TPA: protein kinase [Pseudonocardiaceae bacterium]|nr:protein kinase [Pseudonocardiaceae bacterium]
MNGPSDTLIAGRYRLVERLGSGSMGEVWRAHDERLDRTVAVKQLLTGTGLSDTAAKAGNERAMREARLAARLRHPHAVAVHDVVEHHGQPCLVMDYVPGRSLAGVLADGRTLEPARVARIGAEIAAALAAAHEAGIVHRDVKPDNVLLTDDSGALLTDFGISRAVGDSTVTGPGIVVGTPAYLAPEVAAGGAATFASDVFSLGSTLYAAVQGTPPFGFGENTILLLRAVAAGEVPEPAKAGPLGPVLGWLLRRDPAQRPSMAQSADALAAVADGHPVVPPVPTIRLPGPDRFPLRRRTVAAALAGVGLVAIGLVTGVLIGSDHHTAVVGTQDRPPTAHTRHIQAPTTPEQSEQQHGNGSCVADYSLVNSWQGGYQAQVTVTAGSAAVDGWTVTLTLPDGQTITNVWNGHLSRQGSSATIANLSYNATMAADGSTTFGFLGGLTRGSPADPVVSCTAS